MNELKQILTAYKEAQSKGQSCVLATVTFVEGSSYRRPGARMLVTEDGPWIGCVSGGCLERDLLKKAMWALANKESLLLQYDTREDSAGEDSEPVEIQGASLGCNGYIEILVEPILSGSSHPVLEKFIGWLEQKKSGTVVLFSQSPERKVVFFEGGVFEDLSGHLPKSFMESLTHQKKPQGRDIVIDDQTVRIFVETFLPPLQVTLIGAGYDAVVTADLAVELGYEVTVADLRSSIPLSSGAFKRVKEYVRCEPGDITKNIKLDERSVVIVMTHQGIDDLKILPQILKANPAYVGLLGPKVRGQRLLNECQISRSQNVYFPTGLDIGAETPSEIALSIFAEVNAVLKSRSGGLLKERPGPIHDRSL